MQGIGGFMVLLGAGSFVLHFMDMEFSLLSWVDNWGETAGIAIRVGLIVVGAILWFLGPQQEAKAETPPAT
ncbi:MAG: hypothetical protein H7Y89_02040 [Steroidobacteraceae bacterium]|nr:hypothetical protein [Steroidobacteraceae bacterium]